MKVHVLRLTRGADLKRALDELACEHHWPAACMLTAVGSLTRVYLRFADKAEVTRIDGRFEIVSLCGTLGEHSGSHLHLAVSDGDGHTLGGHLKEGCLVHTTAELVIAVLDDWRFTRTPDPATGYRELRATRDGPTT